MMKAITAIGKHEISLLLCVWMYCISAIGAFSLFPRYIAFPRLTTLNNLGNGAIYGRTCARRFSDLLATRKGSDIGVQEASLEGLGDDHETVGENMAKSVAAWLDSEVRRNVSD